MGEGLFATPLFLIILLGFLVMVVGVFLVFRVLWRLGSKPK
jgi:hypothetical protein